MPSPLHFRIDVQAPWGASEATQRALATPIRVNGIEKLVGTFLGEALCHPFTTSSLPFGMVALGWCKHHEDGARILRPALTEAVRVTALSGAEPHLLGWGRNLPGPMNGGFSLFYSLPLTDVPNDVAIEALRTVGDLFLPEGFSPTISAISKVIMGYSVQVDPVAIVLACAAQSERLAVAKLAEGKARLEASLAISQPPTGY